MKVLRGFVQVCSWIVYAVIIAALLISAPIAAGYRPLVVLSGSMLPKYPVGSITYYKPMDHFEDYSVGDAITFDLGDSGSLATHRIVEIDAESQSFITKGDNNNAQDANPLPFVKVRGRTTAFAIPLAGYFMTYAQKISSIVIMGMILLINLLVGFNTEKNAKESENESASGSTSKQKSDGSGKKKKNLSAEDYFSDF